MEKDIIVEGFKQSELTHGVRYIGLIGDGDSSVHKAVVESVPLYGRRVKKIECANHAVRCYRKSLHDLMDSHSKWKGRYGLSKVKIKKIAAGARAAIRMHSSTGNVLRSVTERFEEWSVSRVWLSQEVQSHILQGQTSYFNW